MSENKGYIHPEVLVDADWVQAHLNDPKVRLIEVDVDNSAYEQGHIPGAVGFNWQKELQDQLVRAPLNKKHLEDLLGRAGVSNDTTIVLYGHNNNWFAAWALWIFKYYEPPFLLETLMAEPRLAPSMRAGAVPSETLPFAAVTVDKVP